MDSLSLIYSLVIFCLELSKNIWVVRWLHIFVQATLNQPWRYREFLNMKATNECPRILSRLFSSFDKCHLFSHCLGPIYGTSYYSLYLDSLFYSHTKSRYGVCTSLIAFHIHVLISHHTCWWRVCKVLKHRSFPEKSINSLKTKTGPIS